MSHLTPYLEDSLSYCHCVITEEMGNYLLQIRRAMPMSAKHLYLKVKDIHYSVVQYSRFWNLDSLLPDRVCVDSTVADHPP